MEDGGRGGRSWNHQCCGRHWIQVRERKRGRLKGDTNYREREEGVNVRVVNNVKEPAGNSTALFFHPSSPLLPLPSCPSLLLPSHTGYSLYNSCLSCGPCAQRGSHSASSSSSQPYSSTNRESEEAEPLRTAVIIIVNRTKEIVHGRSYYS